MQSKVLKYRMKSVTKGKFEDGFCCFSLMIILVEGHSFIVPDNDGLDISLSSGSLFDLDKVFIPTHSSFIFGSNFHYIAGEGISSLMSCCYDSGCRADASEAAIVLLPSNITVFTLDFSGSGLSGGEHVTLGWNEVSVCLYAEEWSESRLRNSGLLFCFVFFPK